MSLSAGPASPSGWHPPWTMSPLARDVLSEEHRASRSHQLGEPMPSLDQHPAQPQEQLKHTHTRYFISHSFNGILSLNCMQSRPKWWLFLGQNTSYPNKEANLKTLSKVRSVTPIEENGISHCSLYHTHIKSLNIICAVIQSASRDNINHENILVFL